MGKGLWWVFIRQMQRASSIRRGAVGDLEVLRPCKNFDDSGAT